MRRTEALQGVRMIKFLSILNRYEASELSQLEASELLGIGERTFRRWHQRFEDDGADGLLDRRLGKASGKRVPVDREAEVEALYRSALSGFHGQAFSRASGAPASLCLGLYVDQDVPAVEGFAGAGSAARRPPAQAAEAVLARHDAASGRLAPCLA